MKQSGAKVRLNSEYGIFFFGSHPTSRILRTDSNRRGNKREMGRMGGGGGEVI